MELTVFRQSSKERPDGNIVYKGEDARPYVDGQLFMVADGLGGAGAIRHQKIRPELFDSEALPGILFDGVWEDYSSEEFLEYVRKSFFELFAVKDIYTANVNNIKKSGYFGSRIVTAIVLHHFLTNEAISAESLFKALENESDEAKKQEAVDKLGTFFTDRIKSELRLAAANANLVYEGAYAGLALLGTTLTATLYRESKNEVEAIYLTAGDSRPYMWNENNGLCQLIPDEEGADGGMTNYIKANDGADFQVHCCYRKFPKPCVLFNASDGCFDSGYFLSQLTFEKVLLETALKSENAEDMSQYLHDFFVNYGRHDDSSTIAMKFFGYSDLDEFKKSAEKRLAVLEERYTSRLPGLLEEDYIGDLERSEDVAKRKIAALGQEKKDSPAITGFCRGQVREQTESDAAVFENDEIKALRESCSAAVKLVDETVSRNLASFILAAPESAGFDRRSAEHILDDGRKYRSNAESYRTQVKQNTERINVISGQLNAIMERINAVGAPDSFEDFSDVNFSELPSCWMSVSGLFNFLEDIRDCRHSTVRSIAARKSRYTENNLRIGYRTPGICKELTSMVISGVIDPAAVELIEGSSEDFIAAVEALRNVESEIARLRSEALERLLTAAADKFWQENSARIIDDIIGGSSDYPEDMTAEIKESVAAINESVNSLADNAALQKQLFDEYDKEYSKFMEGTEE